MLKILAGSIIKRFRKLYISVFAICLLCSILLISLGSAYTSFSASAEAFVSKYGKPDLVIDTELTEDDYPLLPNIEKIKGADKVQSRLCFDTVAESENGKIYSVRVNTYVLDGVFSYCVSGGRELRKGPVVLLNSVFAEANGIVPGDIFEIRIGNLRYKVSVNSLVTSADCISVQPFDFMMFPNNDYGYAYLNRDVLRNSEYSNKMNQLIIDLAPDADVDYVVDQVQECLGNTKILKVQTFENSSSNKKIERNKTILHTMGVVLPFVFFMVSMIVVFLLVQLLLKQYDRELAVLFSNGIEKFKIMILFSTIMALFVLLSWLAGIGISIPLSKFLTITYLDFVGIGEYRFLLSRQSVLFSFVLLLFTVEFPTCLSVARHSAITSKINKSVPFIIRHSKASPLLKANIYSFIQNKKRFLFTVICLACTTAIMFSVFAFQTSKNSIPEVTFDKRWKHNSQIIYSERPEGFDTVVPIYSCVLSNGEKQINSVVYAAGTQIDFENVFDEKGRTISPKDGLVIPAKLARDLKVSAGDDLLCNNETFKVSAISDQRTGFAVFLDENRCSVFGEPDAFIVYTDTDDSNALLKKVCHTDGYLIALFKDVLEKSSIDTFKLYDMIIRVLLGFALLSAMIIDVNTLWCNLIDRKKDYTVLLSLGITIREISKSLIIAEIIQLILASLAGIPLGVFLLNFVSSLLSNENNWFRPVWGLKEILLTEALSMIYIIIGEIASVMEMKKWKLSEEIKDLE